MNDGINLDTEIARKLFRHVVLMEDDGTVFVLTKDTRERFPLPKYSTDVKTAYEVITKLKSVASSFNIKSNIEDGILKWEVYISHDKVPGISFGAISDELPKAICEASLKFLDVVEIQD